MVRSLYSHWKKDKSEKDLVYDFLISVYNASYNVESSVLDDKGYNYFFLLEVEFFGNSLTNGMNSGSPGMYFLKTSGTTKPSSVW